jgi:hypothetical protein
MSELQEQKNTSFSWSGLLGVAAAVCSIAAGIYLFTTESASEETTIFDALFKGLGGYMIARGIWMVASISQKRAA